MKATEIPTPKGCSTFTVEQVEGNKVIIKFIPDVPDYVECVWSADNDFTVGKIYNWPNSIDDDGYVHDIHRLNGNIWKFKPSTKEAFEAQKYIPKVGDCVKFDSVTGTIYGIVSEISKNNISVRFVNPEGIGVVGLFTKSYRFTKITKEELQAKFNEAGFVYDFEKGEVRKLKWIPKILDKYWTIHLGKVESLCYNNGGVDKDFFESNMAFKTKEEAEELLEYIKNFKK